ncbi:MAG TPA: DUF3465 domain-containing protein [Methylotenera sp.]|nr:DUF3465 domain-containing protein [Methylotenera sp.]
MKAIVHRLAFALLVTFVLSACKESTEASELVLVPVQQLAEEQFNTGIEQAFVHKKSDVQVSGQGVVVKLLPDDNKGAQHQKFLVKINENQTLLFAHNIDLAARVPLQVGDEVTFSGEYVYNPKGGIVHWTHLDPQGNHPAGWVMLHGKKYQ